MKLFVHYENCIGTSLTTVLNTRRWAMHCRLSKKAWKKASKGTTTFRWTYLHLHHYTSRSYFRPQICGSWQCVRGSARLGYTSVKVWNGHIPKWTKMENSSESKHCLLLHMEAMAMAIGTVFGLWTAVLQIKQWYAISMSTHAKWRQINTVGNTLEKVTCY